MELMWASKRGNTGSRVRRDDAGVKSRGAGIEEIAEVTKKIHTKKRS